MKSVMVHNFSQVPKADIPRSSFDRSHGVKTTFNAGDLVPILVDEVLPGDTFKVDMTGFARMATPIHPMMDNMFMDTHFFAVPMRLVWDNWKKFNGEQVNPGDSVDYVVPTMTSPTGTGYSNESLSDYFGIPTGVGDLEHSTLFHRAYNLIWNDWFRDQNLQDSVVVDKDDGPDSPADYVILKRGKRHDYFTSSLPWPQKGDSIDLPLGSTAPIIAPDDGANAMIVRKASDGSTPGFAGGLEHANGVNTTLGGGGGDAPVYFDPNGSLSADLSSATAATINELRQAFQVQKLLERDARSGTRYIEIIKSHFGVSSPDMRIQRPEYLGGGSSPVSITPIAQTSSTDGTSPQGNLGAFATASLHNHGFTKSFTEHCIVIGVV